MTQGLGNAVSNSATLAQPDREIPGMPQNPSDKIKAHCPHPQAYTAGTRLSTIRVEGIKLEPLGCRHERSFQVSATLAVAELHLQRLSRCRQRAEGRGQSPGPQWTGCLWGPSHTGARCLCGPAHIQPMFEAAHPQLKHGDAEWFLKRAPIMPMMMAQLVSAVTLTSCAVFTMLFERFKAPECRANLKVAVLL